MIGAGGWGAWIDKDDFFLNFGIEILLLWGWLRRVVSICATDSSNRVCSKEQSAAFKGTG